MIRDYPRRIPWIIHEYTIKTGKSATGAIWRSWELRISPGGKNGVIRRIIFYKSARACVCVVEMEIFQTTRTRRKRFEAETSMSLGHGIVRVLFAANDIISGTAPASGADRSRPRTGDRERHRHVCMRLCAHVCACTCACVRARRDRSRASAYSPSFRRGGR